MWAVVDRKDVWYAPPPDDDNEEMNTEDSTDRGIHHFLKKPGDRLTYVYDWGDNWKHDIELVGFIELDDPCESPFFCVAGGRAGPHENSGGAEGHMRYCDILKEASHPEHDDLRAWIGVDYDPEAFSARQANQLMRRSFV